MAPGQSAQALLDALAVDLIDYHAGHKCRKCTVHITDHEYIASGLFLGLCPPCLSSARQTLRKG